MSDTDKYAEMPEMLDPDVRFLLANERTLLAWVRTGLTLQAGGIALTQIHRTASGAAIGIIVLLLGAFVAILGYNRFKAADKAIRAHRLPKMGRAPLFQVAAVVIIGLLLAAVQIVHLD